VDLYNTNFSQDNYAEATNLPTIKIELSSPMDQEGIFPTSSEPFEPPSFASINTTSENHFLAMRPTSSAFCNTSFISHNYHTSETNCIAL